MSNKSLQLYSNKTVEYLPHIDGLRGIAVLAVVLFHMGAGVSGGYVGVDVFFVISGFIITFIVSTQIESETFKLSEFWKRRILRIAPASLVMLLISGVVGFLILFPDELKELGQAILAQVMLCGNVYQLRERDYFAPSSELAPLLHVWSLAIEEQFYLAYPFLLSFFLPFSRRFTIGSLVVVAFLSLLICDMSVQSGGRSGFYLLPHRAWELIIGCLVALNRSRLTWVRGNWANVIGVVGMAMILWPCLTWDSNVLFPGRAAILPCMGTVLAIIASLNEKSLSGKFLIWKPLTSVGKISYSLYLWHWPVIAFSRHLFLELDSFVIKILLGFVITALSLFSYYVIEKPARGLSSYFSLRTTIMSLGSISVLLIGIGIWLNAFEGLPSRFSKKSLALIKGSEKVKPIYDISVINNDECIKIFEASSPERPTVFVCGDSHTRMLFPVYAELGKEYDVHVDSLFSRGTLPFCDAWSFTIGKSKQLHKLAIHRYLSRNPPDVIILSCRWNAYVSDSEFFIVDEDSVKPGTMNDTKRVFEIQLKNYLNDLSKLGSKMVIIKPVPEPGYHVPRAFAKALKIPLIRFPIKTREEHKDDSAFVNKVFHTLGNEIVLADPSVDLFDEKNRLFVEIDGQLLYDDDDHLSAYGAESLFPCLKRVFELPQLGPTKD